MKNRTERAEQTLREAAAQFFAREAGHQSLVTVTRTLVADDFTRASIFFSVFPVEKEAAVLALANRNIDDFKDYLGKRAKLPRMPHIEFLIDEGEKNRQRLDELSQ